jgi:predicted Rossmann fold nucleotide-binding protein DprA/Smf involved in DNA uptake
MGREVTYHMLGNEALLTLHKTAFLCSRNCPKEVLRRSHDWAVLQRTLGRCVISGFHSAVEKGVLRSLLDGEQPLIVALAKGIGKGIDPELQPALDAGRLLVVTRYADSKTHACEDSCFQRNRLMMQLADQTVIAYASPGGGLERLCRENPSATIIQLETVHLS